MTTPQVMGRIVDSLQTRLSDAEMDTRESHKAAPNSYGAGYDRGYADALMEVLSEITGDSAASNGER